MVKPLNVLHMCLSSGFGGLEMYPIRVGKTMLQQGQYVYGVAQSDTPIHQSMASAFKDTFTLSSRGAGYRQLFKMAKWIKQHEISHVHCHKSSDLMLAVLLKKLCGFTLIYTDHMGVKRPKQDFYHRFIYRNLDLLLSISHFTRSFNVKALPVPPERNKTLWLGTEMADQGLQGLGLKQELGLPETCKMIGIVGRVSHGKGHEELLKAFSLLAREDTHLVIVGGLSSETGGSSEYAQLLKDYVEANGLESKVTFYGFSERTQALLMDMDLVVIPSQLEAFGLTVIEAMAVGKAIVGSCHGAIPEIIADTGVLVDPADSFEFAKALSLLCDDVSERERLSVLSKQRAQEHFDQPKHVQALLALYQEATA